MTNNRPLTTLGFLMQCLHIQTGAMSQALHVDASLVSKWKTGKRPFSEQTAYFDQVVAYLLEESAASDHQLLRDALHELYPQAKIEEDGALGAFLRKALANASINEKTSQQRLLAQGSNMVSVLMFDGASGRREATAKMIDYALHMPSAGELLFLDSEEYAWILEDPDFTQTFITQIITLIHRGFHATFVIHYSKLGDRFTKFFQLCSPLLFHRNIDWYYYEYYDDNILQPSICLLNHALSLFSMTTSEQLSSTMMFTDPACVLQHEKFANSILTHCMNLFQTFEPRDFQELVMDISRFQHHDTLYTYLPVPAFLASGDDLLRNILSENHIPTKEIERQLLISAHFRKATWCQDDTGAHEPIIFILQLEEFLQRLQHQTFISNSLSIVTGRQIHITRSQVAQELRDLAQTLMRNDNLYIVFASEKDKLQLPPVNCWCKKNLWMVQMNMEGFRLSNESSLVTAVASALENCIRRVPPARKEKSAVHQFLIDLADDLEDDGVS